MCNMRIENVEVFDVTKALLDDMLDMPPCK